MASFRSLDRPLSSRPSDQKPVSSDHTPHSCNECPPSFCYFEKVTSPFLLPFFHAFFLIKPPQNAICYFVTFSGRVFPSLIVIVILIRILQPNLNARGPSHLHSLRRLHVDCWLPRLSAPSRGKPRFKTPESEQNAQKPRQIFFRGFP